MGSSYQRMMDLCLAGLDTRSVLAYMDDIVIFSKDFKSHIRILEEVFERLYNTNVSLNLRKCMFGFREVEYLGYELSKKKILSLPFSWKWFRRKKYSEDERSTPCYFIG